MKKWIYISLAAIFLTTCQKPEIGIVDFDTFHATNVKYNDVIVNGALNPEIRTMELGDGDDAKVASVSLANLVENMLETMKSNKIIQIAGTYTGHDIDGTPITLSGKVLLPAKGKIKNMIIVSHWTIGANRECPSESFQMEGILAAKGYAVVMADYIGYGVTSNRIHPYMHIESTARSVVDMALAVKPYLKAIDRKPESDEVILVGYSQGGSTTLGVMRILQDEFSKELPIKAVYAYACHLLRNGNVCNNTLVAECVVADSFDRVSKINKVDIVIVVASHIKSVASDMCDTARDDNLLHKFCLSVGVKSLPRS